MMRQLGIRTGSAGRILLTAYVILFFSFMLAPIVIVVVASFSPKAVITFPIDGFSLRWFKRVWEYEPFLHSLLLSINIAFTSAAIASLIGVPSALILARSKSFVAEAVMTFLLSPLSIPAIVIGFSLLFFVSLIGMGISYWSLLIAHVIASLPYIVRTVSGYYRGMSPNLEEAAAVLGATRWKTFLYVTLPLLKPSIIAGCLFAILISIDNLSISFFFGGATTNTIPVVMLSYLENQFDPSVAAIATIKLAIALALLFIIERLYGLNRLSMG